MDSTVVPEKLYLVDAYCFECEVVALSVERDLVLLNRTCLYPGGGGQPADVGAILPPGGPEHPITVEKSADGAGLLHRLGTQAPQNLVDQSCRLRLDAARRYALMRHHTALHIFNTVMMREFGAWITGVGMAPDHSHIDFKIDGYSDDVRMRAEELINAVILRDLPTRALWVSEEEYRSRPELRRTLDVEPPVEDGRVRVVEIGDFDAQACGGTHVRSTREIGAFRIAKVKSKGRDNRRFHVMLGDPVEGRA